MNPDTGRLEPLSETSVSKLIRPSGEPVPAHWTVLTVGEVVQVKESSFRVAYMNETTLVLEPMKIPILSGVE